MSNSKLYQPPPSPPKPRVAAVDPLVALSKAPTMIAAAPAEELTDLTDDAGLEEWASSGTKVMPKPQSPSQPPPQSMPVPTMMSSPLPSFHPVAYSMAPPQIREKKTSAALWVVPLALFVLAGGAVAAAAGWYVYHTSELASASTADTSSNVTVTSAPTETAPPAVTLTATTTPTVAATATPTATATMTITSSAMKHSTTASTSTATTTTSASVGNGSLRTFAAGNGKPVYVDGKQVGFGGGKITTACGRHVVSVGTGRARSVEIPCNGPTITVGTPDGA